MLINLKELGEGRSRHPFVVPHARYATYVAEADDLYAVAEGECAVDLTLDRVEDVLSLRGTIEGPLQFSCARCLATRQRPLHINVHWTLMPRAKFTAGTTAEEEIELSTDDLDVSFFEGEEIDLEDLVREAILLELDPAPRCEVDACESDGYKAASLVLDEATDDPRWAKLAALRKHRSDSGGSNA